MKKTERLLIKPLKRDAKSKGLWHRHQRGQLFVIEKGLLALQTASERLVMPLNHVGWIPPLTKHCGQYFGTIKGQCFYLPAVMCDILPKKAGVFTLNPLLKEIMARMNTWQFEKWQDKQQHLLQVLLDELRDLPPQSLQVTLPEDKRLQKIAQDYILDPTQNKTLEEWAAQVHMTKRSFTRHFRQQTGLSFVKWRQQVCVQKSLELLAKGKSVTTISFMLGYSSVSSFIKIFQHYLGKSPTQHLSFK